VRFFVRRFTQNHQISVSHAAQELPQLSQLISGMVERRVAADASTLLAPVSSRAFGFSRRRETPSHWRQEWCGCDGGEGRSDERT
jgi:hypothetical protein